MLEDPSHPDHPVNHVAVFTDWPTLRACFGEEKVAEALSYRRALLEQQRIPDDPQQKLHAAGLLGEAIDTASLWTTLFQRAGADLLCPFLDSRTLRMALALDDRDRFPFRRPKGLLRDALARHVPPAIVERRKLGFGQPVFEWMAPGGVLRPMVEAIAPRDFIDRDALNASLARPNWFLFSLLCYDLWSKTFASPTRNEP